MTEKMEKSAAADQTYQNGKERVEGLTSGEGKEMDILKDLPSYNRTNFSRLLPQGASSNGFPTAKNNSVRLLCSDKPKGTIFLFYNV